MSVQVMHVDPEGKKLTLSLIGSADDEASPHGNDGDPKTTGDLVTTKSEANKWEDEFLEERMEIQKLDEAGKKENGMDHLLEHMNIVNDLYSAHTKKESSETNVTARRVIVTSAVARFLKGRCDTTCTGLRTSRWRA